MVGDGPRRESGYKHMSGRRNIGIKVPGAGNIGGLCPVEFRGERQGVLRMKKGFSLIELLVVIAIIGILAGITFPVFARAKESAYRSSDMSSMNALRSALQLYRADQGAYPPSLYGYATAYSDITPTASTVVPANQAVGALFPKRVESQETFRPSYVRPTAGDLQKEFSTAVWPSAGGSGDDSNASQRFGPEQVVMRRYDDPVEGCREVPNYYYRLSGYDAAEVKTPAAEGGKRTELRYTLFWSRYSVPTSPCDAVSGAGSASDDPRQLGYTEPPDTTVITWDSFFRDYDANGNTTRTKKDLVLFLGGSARPYDSAEVASKSWRVKP